MSAGIRVKKNQARPGQEMASNGNVMVVVVLVVIVGNS